MTSRFWTISALYCYNIKGECKNCQIAKELESLPEQCKMKKTIEKLLKTFGKPI